ncbi:hypothetical protein ACOI1H_19330 [Loktanella sp. DJP18]|uniref:hypothetical protein n=1 Tax=Loktanella sp. DJP18 TaxID=3409788 RepID=UPI003BB71FA5
MRDIDYRQATGPQRQTGTPISSTTTTSGMNVARHRAQYSTGTIFGLMDGKAWP